MSTTEWVRNPQTNAPCSITEPAALAGIEPAAWRWTWKTSREQDGYCYTHTHPNKPLLQDIEALYSAADVERLVQERDRLQTIDLDLQMAVQKLAAMTQERDTLDHELKKSQIISAGMVDQVEEIEQQLAAAQAREQQLREALKKIQFGNTKFDRTGDSQDYCPECNGTAYTGHDSGCFVQKALALPQDDTALPQWGAELLSFLRSPAQVQADAVRAWMATPEGKAALERSLLDAKASIRKLDAARVIHWQDLQEPFTI